MLSFCTHLYYLEGTHLQAQLFCFLGKDGQSSFFLHHPGTFKIIVMHFNYNLPGGSTALWEFPDDLKQVISLSFIVLSVCLSVYLSFKCLLDMELRRGTNRVFVFLL